MQDWARVVIQFNPPSLSFHLIYACIASFLPVNLCSFQLFTILFVPITVLCFFSEYFKIYFLVILCILIAKVPNLYKFSCWFYISFHSYDLIFNASIIMMCTKKFFLLFSGSYPVETSVYQCSYLHRVGRTARAGREGYAVTFVTDDDRSLLKSIVRI